MTKDDYRQIRKDLGLTLEAMAAELRTDLGSVSRWERGARSPSGAVVRLYELLRDGTIRPAGKGEAG